MLFEDPRLQLVAFLGEHENPFIEFADALGLSDEQRFALVGERLFTLLREFARGRFGGEMPQRLDVVGGFDGVGAH